MNAASVSRLCAQPPSIVAGQRRALENVEQGRGRWARTWLEIVVALEGREGIDCDPLAGFKGMS